MRSLCSLLLAICVVVSASAPTPTFTSFPFLSRNLIEVLSRKESGGAAPAPEYGVNSPNVVSVPDNCPTGQELINGQCRDIWRSAVTSDVDTTNVISVPPNCPDGQQFINGQCREILPKIQIIDHPAFSQNVAAISENCPNGEQLVNGVCGKIQNKVTVAEIAALAENKVISFPDNCPSGQQLVNGHCRHTWTRVSIVDTFDSDRKNVVIVPDNCAIGQQLINGQCRDIWKNRRAEPSKNRSTESDIAEMVETLQEISFKESDIEILLRNIVQVPNQCPDGYRPDSGGVCREIWKKLSK